jgi:hypothetical protein
MSVVWAAALCQPLQPGANKATSAASAKPAAGLVSVLLNRVVNVRLRMTISQC